MQRIITMGNNHKPHLWGTGTCTQMPDYTEILKTSSSFNSGFSVRVRT